VWPEFWTEKLQHLECKSTKNHQKLVPVLGFSWKLIRNGQKGISLHFQSLVAGGDGIFSHENYLISCFET